MRPEVHSNPPKWAVRFLRLFMKEHFVEELEGDLYERYMDNLEVYGLRKANWLYMLDTFKLCRLNLMKSVGGELRLNALGMFTHQLKIAWRQTQNQKLYSTIKIGGFALSITACILISLYVRHQSSFDKNYINNDRLYRLVNRWSEAGETGYWSNVHGPLKSILEDHIPEMEKVARIVLWSWGNAGENHIRPVDSPYNTYEGGFIYADPEFLEILDVPMVFGSQENALDQPNSLVISRKKAAQYFGDQNPIGQRIILNDNPDDTYMITGVMEDFPENSHLQSGFIMTLSGRKYGPGTTGWCCTNYNIYTRLTPGANKLQVEEKTVDIRNTHIIDQLIDDGQTGIEDILNYQSYYLQPVSDVYLNPEEVEDDLHHGSGDLLWIFQLLTGIILLQACINFINLSTANAIKRAKEVGLRKVVGSFRSNLIFQFLLESCFFTMLAILIGVILTVLILPFFNVMANTSIEIPWASTWFVPLLISLGIVIGMISGIYPAFYLSGFRPIQALKSAIITSGKVSWLTSGLIIFQFTTTVILIMAALVIHQQFELFMNKSLGYDKEQVVNLLGLETLNDSERQVLKAEITQLSMVSHTSLSDYLPVVGSAIQNRTFWNAEERMMDLGREAAYWTVDEDYISTMGMKMVAGRNFNHDLKDDQSIIINESMVEALNLKSPVGQEVIDMFDEKYSIVGVVKDFNFETLFKEIRPLALVKGNGISTMSLRLDHSDLDLALNSIESVWYDIKPHQSIRLRFMDDRFENMYDDVNRAKTIFIFSSLLSIVIACSGLFALSLNLVSRRSKEVSIRKVLGAEVQSIIWLLSHYFLRLVCVAIIIAIPLGWYGMDEILAELPHRVDLSLSVFATSAAISLIIALITISTEIFKAALNNPANQLRHE